MTTFSSLAIIPLQFFIHSSVIPTSNINRSNSQTKRNSSNIHQRILKELGDNIEDSGYKKRGKRTREKKDDNKEADGVLCFVWL